MLVSHPSSSCDVCLDPYRLDSDGPPVVNKRHPHVLPCGHTFCKACLYEIITGNNRPKCHCPLCRHPFGRADVKKLHIKGLEEDPADNVLRALYNAWDSRNADLTHLIVRAEKMLQHHSEHVGLRIALKALSERKDMRLEVTENERTIRTYRSMLGKFRSHADKDDVLRVQNKSMTPPSRCKLESLFPEDVRPIRPLNSTPASTGRKKSSPILQARASRVEISKWVEKIEKPLSPKQDPVRINNIQHERRKSLGNSSSKPGDNDIYYHRRLSLLFRA